MSRRDSSSDHRAVLHQAIEACARGADLEAALAGLLAATATRFGAVMGAIVITDPDRSTLQLAESFGMDEAARARLEASVADPADPFAVAASTRVADFGREAVLPDGSAFVGAYLPLVTSSGGREESVGAMGLGWAPPRSLDDLERETLADLASLAALAIDRARLASTAAERSEWFERMAHTDPLTGLANERTVSRVLELELARAGRQNSELSLAIFDVDDFQATNKVGGPEAGDDVLRRVAAVLAESVRLVDTVGRIGGDEFVLIGPGSAGAAVAQRVLDAVATLPPVGGRTVTVSAGVARFPTDGTDAETLIAAAAEALAQARAGGRGTVAGGVDGMAGRTATAGEATQPAE